MKRLWKLGAVLLALALVAAACGDDSDSETTVGTAATTTTSTAPAGAVPDLVEDGKLILVTTGNFPPFTKINESTGDNEGYSVDIAKEIASRLGLELELPTIDFVAELEGLAQGLYDMADSGINPSAERQALGFVFSIPMTSTGIIGQVRAEDAATSPGLTIGGMAGLNVGGIQGSRQELFVLDNEAALGYDEYLGFTGAAEALTALRQGRVDVLSQDIFVASRAAADFDDLAVAGPTVEAAPLSITYREGSEAKRDAIDVVIKQMLADGAIAEIQKEWFGSCIPVPDDINAAPPYTDLPGGDCS